MPRCKLLDSILEPSKRALRSFISTSMAGRLPYHPLSDALAPYTNPPPLQPFELGLFESDVLRESRPDELQPPPDHPDDDHTEPITDESQPDQAVQAEADSISLKRKRALSTVAPAKRAKLEDPSTTTNPPAPSASTSQSVPSHRFTTPSTPIPASAMSHKVPPVERPYHDFQWRILTLCGEFYDAATKLVEDAPPEVINRCYRMHEPHSINPLAVLNEAKKTCDFLLQQTASLTGRPASPTPSPSALGPFSFLSTRPSSPSRPSLASRIASSFTRPSTGGISIFDSFRPASATPTSATARRTPTATPVESSPQRSARSPTLFPPSQTTITQNQGPWTDQENERLRKLAERHKLSNGDTDWHKVAADFGPTRSKHQVLIKATSLGLKPSSTRPSRRARDPATSSSGTGGTGGGENPRSPSQTVSTPGAPTPGTSTVPLHSHSHIQRTPRTPITPLEIPMTAPYPSMGPQTTPTAAAAGMPGMMWSTAAPAGNGTYYRQRPSQTHALYHEAITDDPQTNPYLWIQQQPTRSPSQDGHSHSQGQSRNYGF